MVCWYLMIVRFYPWIFIFSASPWHDNFKYCNFWDGNKFALLCIFMFDKPSKPNHLWIWPLNDASESFVIIFLDVIEWLTFTFSSSKISCCLFFSTMKESMSFYSHDVKIILNNLFNSLSNLVVSFFNSEVVLFHRYLNQFW